MFSKGLGTILVLHLVGRLSYTGKPTFSSVHKTAICNFPRKQLTITRCYDLKLKSECLPSLVWSNLGFNVVVFFSTFSSSFFWAPTPASSRSSPAHLTRWPGRRSISQITAAASPSCPPSSTRAPPPAPARGKSLLAGSPPPAPLPPPVCPPPNRFVRRPACAPCTQFCSAAMHAVQYRSEARSSSGWGLDSSKMRGGRTGGEYNSS